MLHVVLLVGLFIGMIVSLQTGIELSRIGQQDQIGTIVALSHGARDGPVHHGHDPGGHGRQRDGGGARHDGGQRRALGARGACRSTASASWSCRASSALAVMCPLLDGRVRHDRHPRRRLRRRSRSSTWAGSSTSTRRIDALQDPASLAARCPRTSTRASSRPSCFGVVDRRRSPARAGLQRARRRARRRQRDAPGGARLDHRHHRLQLLPDLVLLPAVSRAASPAAVRAGRARGAHPLPRRAQGLRQPQGARRARPSRCSAARPSRIMGPSGYGQVGHPAARHRPDAARLGPGRGRGPRHVHDLAARPARDAHAHGLRLPGGAP